MGPFDIVEAAANITLDDVMSRLAGHFDENRMALSVINPVA
jgi:hypothetical protein